MNRESYKNYFRKKLFEYRDADPPGPILNDQGNEYNPINPWENYRYPLNWNPFPFSPLPVPGSVDQEQNFGAALWSMMPPEVFNQYLINDPDFRFRLITYWLEHGLLPPQIPSSFYETFVDNEKVIHTLSRIAVGIMRNDPKHTLPWWYPGIETYFVENGYITLEEWNQWQREANDPRMKPPRQLEDDELDNTLT